jgi:hypothetical protein
MLFLCEHLRGHIVGFNELMGNSLERFHVVSHEPPHGFGPYPLQLAFAERRRSIEHIGPDAFPTRVWRIAREDNWATATIAAGLMAVWREIAGPFASANVAAAFEEGRPVIYLTPRHRSVRAIGWESPAFLELLGLFVASPDVFARVQTAHCGFDFFWQVLASLSITGTAARQIEIAIEATGRLEKWQLESQHYQS